MVGAVNAPVAQVYVDVPEGNNVGVVAAHLYTSNMAVRLPLVPAAPVGVDTLADQVMLVVAVVLLSA